MPQMKMSVSHSLDVDDARDRVKNLMNRFKSQVDYTINGVRQSWVDNTAHFSLYIMGFFVEGNLYVEPTMVRLEAAFPFAALPFKSMVKRDIEKSARELLGRQAVAQIPFRLA